MAHPNVRPPPQHRKPYRILSRVAPSQQRGDEATLLSVIDLLECLETGREPELSSRRALDATELIFATYESSRRRARILLPLDTEDSALLTGLEQGFWQPADPPACA